MPLPENEDSTDRIREVISSIAIPAVFVIVTICAGTSGYFLHLSGLPSHKDATTLSILLEGFFRSLSFLVLSMGSVPVSESVQFVLLSVGRASGLLFFSYAALISIGVVFADQLRPLRVEIWAALSYLPTIENRGHVIVCGIGEDGYAIAKEFLESGEKVVAIDTDPTGQLADLKTEGAVVFTDDATREGVLTDYARLHHATEVFATTGSDTANGDIVEIVNRWAKSNNKTNVIEITARMDDKRLRRTLHEETMPIGTVLFRTYNVPSATARELLTAYPVDNIMHTDQRIHVWIVGWTAFSEALLDQLLNLMHYPDSIDRKVTVITTQPEYVEREIASLSPGIDPEWWDDPSMQMFVKELFPDIEIHQLPGSDMELLSNQNALYDNLKVGDKLTIVADDVDEGSLRGLLSTWGPKLDELTRQFDLDARIAYRSSADTEWTPPLSAMATHSYEAFEDGCSIESVRGEKRDRVAKRLALVYHLLYEEDPVEVFPWRESLPLEKETDIEEVLSWLEELSTSERERHATVVWRSLPENQRESNRHAADHAVIKHRMASVLGDPKGENISTVRDLAESEHRRWCAEKILDGWEPLPNEEKGRWEQEDGERMLREQRYHPDIVPVEPLREKMDGEWDKDISQVKSILMHPELFVDSRNREN